MDEKSVDKYHRAMGDFYYFIVWGMTERLVRELKPPSLDNLKRTIFDPFIRYLEGNMTSSEFEKILKKELTRYEIDIKVQEYVINIFETFIERLSEILKDT
ncbi:MAG: hypothetical protein ACFE7E_09175, partial [Candidatus Hodarchaeota archaeon]